MKEVLSRTVSLLRRYPILWLPQFCVMCLVVIVQNIYSLIAAAIWHMLWHPPATSSDDLFGMLSRPTPPRGVLIERSLLTTPVLLLTDYVDIALCATACVVVAILVSRIIRGLPTAPKNALPSAKQKTSGILYLALVAIGVCMLKMFLGFLLITWLSTRPGFEKTAFWRIEALGWIIDIVFLLAIAYFIVPIALSIAGAEESFLPSPQNIRWSRMFAVITIIACIGLQLGWAKVENNLIFSIYDPTALWFFTFSFVSTIISAVALTFLSTALAVTANRDPGYPPSNEAALS